MKSFVSVAPGGHYHDWYRSRDRTNTKAFVILDYDAWERWYYAARGAQSAKEQVAAAALLPDPISRHDSHETVNAERDRLNLAQIAATQVAPEGTDAAS